MPRLIPAAQARSESVNTLIFFSGAQLLTLPVDGKIKIVNLAVLAKDFVQVVLIDVLGQAFDDNLYYLWLVSPAMQTHWGPTCLGGLHPGTLAAGPAPGAASVTAVASLARIAAAPAPAATAAERAAETATAAAATVPAISRRRATTVVHRGRS